MAVQDPLPAIHPVLPLENPLQPHPSQSGRVLPANESTFPAAQGEPPKQTLHFSQSPSPLNLIWSKSQELYPSHVNPKLSIFEQELIISQEALGKEARITALVSNVWLCLENKFQGNNANSS